MLKNIIMKKIWVLLIVLFLSPVAHSQTISPPPGRIAIVADGNSPDPDDLGGTAVSIALLRAAGLEDRLVHYSHSCDLVGDHRITAKPERERHHLMQLSCDVTARRWGGFDNLVFYDALWQKKQTQDHPYRQWSPIPPATGCPECCLSSRAPVPVQWHSPP